MKRVTSYKWVLSTILIGLSACNANLGTTSLASDLGSSSADSDTTTVTGTIDASSDPSLSTTQFLQTSATSCSADEVIATDTIGNTVRGRLDANSCSFSISLENNKSYNIGFMLNDIFIAPLTFDSGLNGFSTTELPLMGVGSGRLIDLGSVSLQGSTAIPARNPLENVDADSDGLNDFADLDDDNDGTADELEEDCDLDGVRDDNDQSCSCRGQRSIVQVGDVLEVRPLAGNRRQLGFVRLDRRIRARFACLIDETTVNSSTFSVISEDASHEVQCDYEVKSYVGSEMSQVICHHPDDLFQANTSYEVSISGMTCDDGTAVEDKQWTFEVQNDPAHDHLFSDHEDLEDRMEQSHSWRDFVIQIGLDPDSFSNQSDDSDVNDEDDSEDDSEIETENEDEDESQDDEVSDDDSEEEMTS